MNAIESRPSSNSELSSVSRATKSLGMTSRTSVNTVSAIARGVCANFKTNGHLPTPFGCAAGRSAGQLERRSALSQKPPRKRGRRELITLQYKG